MHVFSKENVTDSEKMSQLKIDCLKITPSNWKMLNEKNKLFVPTKCLIFGGEILNSNILEQIKLYGAKYSIFNHYGPYETTIGKLIKFIELGLDNSIIPLGSPFGNTQIYILFNINILQPMGVIDEICKGGDGLARGYLNRTDLTAEKFMSNYFNEG